MRVPDISSIPPKPPGRTKRLIRYVLSPGRLAFGAPVAAFTAWLDYGHLTNSDFWDTYLCWIAACFLLFWLYEVHAWASGKRRPE